MMFKIKNMINASSSNWPWRRTNI